MEEKSKLICDRCKVEMVEKEVQFSYLKLSFSHKVPRCPECGQVYITEKLATGKMNEVEINLEEK